MSKFNIYFFGIIILCHSVYAQDKVVDGYNRFYYSSGKVASEGNFKDGKPDGYWKTYYTTGIKKSEGTRTNYLLDSIWIFYTEKGDTLSKISYLRGKKNGYLVTYGSAAGKNYLLSKELYIDDKKQGVSYYYLPNGLLDKTVCYRDGRRNGLSKIYSKAGVITTIENYQSDFLIDSENINKTDEQNRKQGVWKEFFLNDVLKIEAHYFNNLLDGDYKEFNMTGSLLVYQRYQNGIPVVETAVDENKIEIKNTYYINGAVKTSGPYKDTIKVGIHRTYNQEGKISASIIYDDFGLLLSTGIVGKDGDKHGNWTDFYPSGKVKAKGKYKNNKRIDDWQFFYESGTIEQIGAYDNGKMNGEWKWYFDTGKLLRQEKFENGAENGLMVEYDSIGTVITKGTYIDGEKDGQWLYQVGGVIEEGEYKNGLKQGTWKHYYAYNKVRKFEGNFFQGQPNGKHTWYFDNGNIQLFGEYVMGEKERRWYEYDEEGNLVQTIVYHHDVELSIDGFKIK